MDFEVLERFDDTETGMVKIDVELSSQQVDEQLKEFYAAIVPVCGVAADASRDEIDDAALRTMPFDRYREMQRDFVVNRAASNAFERLGVEPALTPGVRVFDYPTEGRGFAFKLSVAEHPVLGLSSCEPVVVEFDEIVVDDALVDARISQLLEANAIYEEDEPRSVRLGDSVCVNIMTMRDDKTVPHLTGSKMLLDIEPGVMPDGFIEGMVGLEVGQTKVVDYVVERPRALMEGDVDRYQATVTVLSQQRKAVPELSDEWVAENIESASTVDDFCLAVRAELEQSAVLANRDTCARLANIELEKRLVGTIPDAFYQASREGLMRKLERELAEKGQSLDDYYEREGKNEEELSVEMLIKSAENLRQGFALEALFDGRGMHLTDDDLRYACEEAFGPGSYEKGHLEKTGKASLVEASAKRMVALNWLIDTAIVRGS